ncbi:hypothetical protein EPYR_01778 [Erwinia pyrifoliae DSM 12163]|nr:hypothetical protein EPYR_01778 [Erwinia pyrifoliae DSM 12163]
MKNNRQDIELNHIFIFNLPAVQISRSTWSEDKQIKPNLLK